jgi:hypothetical protein
MIGRNSLLLVFFFLYSVNERMGEFNAMINQGILILVFGVILGFSGCAKEVGPLPDSLPSNKPVAFGKIQAYLTGPTNRWYTPQVRFFELKNLKTNDRVRVDVASADSPFFISLPAGEYELARVQINEGAFRSMAQLNETFEVSDGALNYLGKWELKIHPPTYLRLVDISVESDLEEAKAELFSLHPDLEGLPIVAKLPTPQAKETRLVEIAPYPRMWWFCRHLTC